MPLSDSAQAGALQLAAERFVETGHGNNTRTRARAFDDLLEAALAYAAAVNNPDGGDGTEPL